MASVDFFDRAWDEFIELQVMDKEAWVRMSIESITERPRYELLMVHGDTQTGGCIITWDTDGHVGDCMAVMFNYVLPEYRRGRIGYELYRAAVALTRSNHIGILAYTHRVRDWEYVTKYRKVG